MLVMVVDLVIYVVGWWIKIAMGMEWNGMVGIGIVIGLTYWQEEQDLAVLDGIISRFRIW